jgi:hypothetical protein
VARAANAKAGTTLPPMPNPACCRANTAVGPAANGKPGMSTWHMIFCIKKRISLRSAAQGAGDHTGGTLPPGHAGAWALAAGPCRHRPRRHVPRVAWPGVPPLREGLFWQIFSEVVSFDISLVHVVSSVKKFKLANLECFLLRTACAC